MEATPDDAEWPVHYLAAFHPVAAVAAAAGKRSRRSAVTVPAKDSRSACSWGLTTPLAALSGTDCVRAGRHNFSGTNCVLAGVGSNILMAWT